MPPTSSKTVWLVLVSVLLVTWRSVGIHLQEKEREVTERSARLRDARAAVQSAEENRQKEQFRLELQAIKSAGEREGNERRSRLDAEISRAIGGPIQKALKNPDVDIAGMLRSTALACLPPNARIEVTTDRFTEFTVHIDVSDVLAGAELARMLGQFLSHCAPYVHAVRVKAPPRTDAIVDHALIERVRKWETDGVVALQTRLEQASEPVRQWNGKQQF